MALKTRSAAGRGITATSREKIAAPSRASIKRAAELPHAKGAQCTTADVYFS
jgi:hypothetical protein